MEVRKLSEIVAQQQLELSKTDKKRWCSRKEESLLELNSPLAQIVIGVRRSGKSTLCHKFLQDNNTKYAYVNFDDDRLVDFKPDNFDNLLEALYFVYGDFDYLFLDEPQNIFKWHLFVNRLLRQNLKIFITGSNAKLLSSELASHLTGRYNQVELFPLSFGEFISLKEISTNTLLIKNRADIRLAFQEYIEKGGLPELLHIKSWQNYVRTLFGAIVERDIAQRFKIRHKQSLKDVAQYALDNFAREFNISKIAKNLSATSDNTIKNYFNYLEHAYLLIGLNKFSYKSRERIRNKKYYIVDTAFVSALKTLSGENLGWKLENIVLVELMRRRHQTGYSIHYFRSHYEIDFVLSQGNQVRQLIQITTDMTNEKTFNREINALQNGCKQLKCNDLLIITLDKNETFEINNIKINVVSIHDWLIKDLSFTEK